MELFKIKNLNYKDIVKYSDFAIKKDKVTFVTGKSGCGKSTLLKLLNGVYSPTNGEILYLSKNVSEYDSISLRREVLLCSQSIYLSDTDIKDNFDEFYSLREQTPLSESEMKKYLNLCALDMPLDTLCTTMSGGERQRAYIAICLSFSPKVLLLDEPTSALDSETGQLFFTNLIAHCKQNGMSLICISHSSEIVEKFAEEKLVLGGDCR